MSARKLGREERKEMYIQSFTDRVKIVSVMIIVT